MIWSISLSGAVSPVAMVTVLDTYSSDALLAKEGLLNKAVRNTLKSCSSVSCVGLSNLLYYCQPFLFLVVVCLFSSSFHSLFFPLSPTLSSFLFACLPLSLPIQGFFSDGGDNFLVIVCLLSSSFHSLFFPRPPTLSSFLFACLPFSLPIQRFFVMEKEITS